MHVCVHCVLHIHMQLCTLSMCMCAHVCILSCLLCNVCIDAMHITMCNALSQVSLFPEDEYLCLHVPGLTKRKKPVMVGDKLIFSTYKPGRYCQVGICTLILSLRI